MVTTFQQNIQPCRLVVKKELDYGGTGKDALEAGVHVTSVPEVPEAAPEGVPETTTAPEDDV